VKKLDTACILINCILVFIIVLLLFNDQANIKKIVNNNINSVVEIDSVINGTSISKGTGVVVDNNYILSNYHIFKNKENNKIIIRFFKDNKEYSPSLIHYNENTDLALLKITNLNKKVDSIKIADLNKVEYADEIITIGNSRGYGLSINKGIVSAPLRILEIDDLERKVIQISVSIKEGDSEGPVINRDGKMIGLMSFKTKSVLTNNDEISFAIPSSVIKDFLSSYSKQ